MSELLAMSTDEFENHISQYGAADLLDFMRALSALKESDDGSLTSSDAETVCKRVHLLAKEVDEAIEDIRQDVKRMLE
jgi:hypothetical protein